MAIFFLPTEQVGTVVVASADPDAARSCVFLQPSRQRRPVHAKTSDELAETVDVRVKKRVSQLNSRHLFRNMSRVSLPSGAARVNEEFRGSPMIP